MNNSRDVKFTGIITNWSKVGNTIVGNLHNDTRGRWPEGSYIRTSSAIEFGDGWVRTLNSLYALVDKEQTKGSTIND